MGAPPAPFSWSTRRSLELPKTGTSVHLQTGHRAGAAIVADVNECENCVGYLVPCMGLEGLCPGLHVNLHLSASNALDRCVNLQSVTNPHRLDESHGFNS